MSRLRYFLLNFDFEKCAIKILKEKEHKKYSKKKEINLNDWKEEGSLNNLKDVHKFYCDPIIEIEKDTRNIFVKGTLNDVKQNFQVCFF